MPPHRHDVKVRFYELDPYGHLNHAVYVQYFEVGRVELLAEAGIALPALADRGVHVVVARIETTFLRPVVADDVVTIETEIETLRRASSQWRQRLLRNDEEVATQRLRVGVTDPDGRPMRAPDWVDERLRPYVAAG